MEPLALVCDRSPSLAVNRSPRSCEGVRKYLLQVLSSRPKTSTERAFTLTLIQASGTWMYSTLAEVTRRDRIRPARHLKNLATAMGRGQQI